MALFKGGETAVVTGAANGIGRAVAERLASEGVWVAVVDRDEARGTAAAQALQKKGVESFFQPCDVADSASVAGVVDEVVRRWKKLDILVNCAGVAGDAVPLWEVDDAEWQRVLGINLTGVFNFCRAAAPHMRRAGYGRIVNIASIAGKEGNPNAVAYSATKAGVIGLTKSVAKEVAADGILVNSVAPAVIKTPILEQLTQEHIDYMVQRIPMGRVGQPEEVAALIAWLCSTECSFSTGACYDISGGRATY